jgi:non-specific serine/threonine protein kinase
MVALAHARDLPRPLTSIIGRDTEIAAACALLVDDGVRLLTLTGPGGVGKTRLALRIAEEVALAFADGVAFVSLAAITDSDLVLSTIARELGLRETGARSTADLVEDYLRERRLLLVLDNFEQVQTAATHLASLLAACPALVVLVTSRALLRIAGEQRFAVLPLPLPSTTIARAVPVAASQLANIAASEAVQLFIARGQAVAPRFDLAPNNAVAIAEICRRLDGLPLAIELAAAWVRVLPPAALLERLEPRLPLLRGGADDQPERLRTMRDAIAWSYDLLSPEEAQLFRRIAIFAGGLPLEAVDQVARPNREVEVSSSREEEALSAPPPSLHLPITPAPSSDTLDLLASLIDKSLVRSTGETSQARFGMLETIREFGLERLRESGEAETMAARHAAWCVRLAEGVRRSGRLSHAEGLAALEIEFPNLRAALAWLLGQGEVTAAQHLAGELAEFWLRHGHWAEGQAWLEHVLSVDTDRPTAARAEALVGLSLMQWSQVAFGRAADLLAEAEAVARAAGDAGALAYARLHQGYVAALSGDLDLAVARGEEASTTCEAIPQAFSCNAAVWLLARATLARGENTRAAALYEQLLAAGRTAGDQISVANALIGRANLAERRGDLGGAIDGFVEAALVCREFGDSMFASHSLNAVAVTLAEHGWPEPAVRLLAAVESLHATAGVTPGPGFHVDHQRHEQARAAARAALGAQGFAAAWTAGAALSLDEAITEAAVLVDLETGPVSGHPAVRSALTAREQEVLRLVVRGWSDKEIARALGIGRRTVSSHVAVIRDKLAVPSRAAAAAVAVRDRLV